MEQTVQILRGLKTRFEEHHGVKYSSTALTTAAELAARFINDRHLPDKAIDVIDEAGAAQPHPAAVASQEDHRQGRHRRHHREDCPDPAAKNVSSDDRSKLATIERDLKNVVFGQDPAIEALAAAIKMARSGLGNPEKPIGSFLFSGPTGVGKTEVARQLAFILGIELIRFDMSEYMERPWQCRVSLAHTPGYVGFDQGGLLTEAIAKKPHARAADGRNREGTSGLCSSILLQVMDHGTLTDNNGRKADFRNVIIHHDDQCGCRSAATHFDRFHGEQAGRR